MWHMFQKALTSFCGLKRPKLQINDVETYNNFVRKTM